MAGYLGASPVPQTIQKKQSFTATASQTTFTTTGYTDGQFINVYLNGVRLINGTDYTATNGSDIVLTTGASASDVLDFETFNEFTLIDQTLETPTFRTSATLKNDTEEDTDGGRESTIIFKGEQSGGEISTLAEIEASHDGASDDEKGDLIFKTNDGSDGSSPTEAARIDSSQNLLVGKTAVGLSTTGIDLRSNGLIQAIRDGGTPVELNRQTSDGTLIDLRKDNTTVGSVGIQSSGFYIDGESGHEGIRFGNGSVNPRENGSDSDGVSSLGTSSTRWQNIYLSGGAYIGGTGAANYLEDYEEGTFTPSYDTSNNDASGQSYGASTKGSYVKIGRFIHFQLTVHLSSLTSTGTGTPQIRGLPYSSSGSTPTNESTRFTISTYLVNIDGGAGQTVHAYFPTLNVTYLQFLTTNDNAAWSVNTTSTFTVASNSFVTISGNYITN